MKITTKQINAIHETMVAKLKREDKRFEITAEYFEASKDQAFDLVIYVEYMTPDHGIQFIGRYI